MLPITLGKFHPSAILMTVFNKVGNRCTTLTLRRVRVTIFCPGKAIIITYSECVYVTLVVQHMQSACVLLACPAVPYFLTLSQR